MSLTFNALYLGMPGVMIDPVENDGGGAVNQTAENAAALLGRSFGGPGQALADDWVSVTAVDRGGVAGVLDMNNSRATDQIIVNDGPMAGRQDFDGVAVYEATITYLDGTTAEVQLIIAQMTSGALYALPSPTAGTATNAAMTAGAIQSITLTGVVNAVYAGATADRAVLPYVTCMARGTRLLTAGGLRRIETLRRGDLVITADHGAQPVLLITRRRIGPGQMARSVALRPVRFAPMSLTAFGIPGPARALFLSRQHRVALPGPAGQEVLVPAGALCGMPGVAPVLPDRAVHYYHLLLPGHELVWAEGLRIESLFTGDMVLAELPPVLRAGLMLRHGPGALHARPARPMLPMGQARRWLAGRLAAQGIPVPEPGHRDRSATDPLATGTAGTGPGPETACPDPA